METNFILNFADRNIEQRLSDNFINAGQLLEQWNAENPNNTKSIKEFIPTLDELKSEGLVSDTDIKFESGEVWMNYIVFMEFYTWLDPKFHLWFIKTAYKDFSDVNFFSNSDQQ